MILSSVSSPEQIAWKEMLICVQPSITAMGQKFTGLSHSERNHLLHLTYFLKKFFI